MFDIKSKHFEYEVIHTLKDGWKRTLKISLISHVFSAIQHNMGTAAISIWSSSLGMRSFSQSRAHANFLWPRMSLWKENKELYFVTKIVLTYCEKKLFTGSRKTFEMRVWKPRICKFFEITRTIHSNSERSEHFW